MSLVAGAPVRILMTDGTGFIGPHLAARLTHDGHEVIILMQTSGEKTRVTPRASFLEGDPTQRGAWQEAIRKQDAVINLAGASIFSWWTDQRIHVAIPSVARRSRMPGVSNMTPFPPVRLLDQRF